MKTKLKKSLPPLKAIRAKCLDCCYDQSKEVLLCPCDDCSLYPYRLGKNPTPRAISEKQRTAASIRMTATRQKAR
jgi:hypothetical protein